MAENAARRAGEPVSYRGGGWSANPSMDVAMILTEIWRYPVKTMAGEKLQRVHMGALGINGDRVVHIEDAQGRVITSRSHPRFLGHKGSLGTDGAPRVDGRPWNSPEMAAEVVDIGGPGAKLIRYDGSERFDVLPLLVATDGAIAAFGHDHRRLRPNIVIGGVAPKAASKSVGSATSIAPVASRNVISFKPVNGSLIWRTTPTMRAPLRSSSSVIDPIARSSAGSRPKPESSTR